MTRHIVIGNGNLLVNLDQWMQVRDFYYPNVGQENHLIGHAHRIGVFVDSKISWINQNEWKRKLNYKKETLVSETNATRDDCELIINDCVHCTDPIYLKKIIIKNKKNVDREFKIFFHHDFCLYGDGIGDTAGYDPSRNIIFHYKKNRYFLINSSTCDKHKKGDIYEYNVGNANGTTFEDANDGKLEKKPIIQGEADSIISIKANLAANSKYTFYYWISCAKNYEDAKNLNDKVMNLGVETLFTETELCWRGWVNAHPIDKADLDEQTIELYKKSLLIIKTQINHNGAIIAANDSDNTQFNKDTYSYTWIRDASIIANALQKAGYSNETKKFYIFCSNIISKQGCFLHKYNPDGSLGSSWHPWIRDGKPSLPIQEDGTGLIIESFYDYYTRTNDKDILNQLYSKLIKPVADFMVSYRHSCGLPKESYDLWEEYYGVSLFATVAVYRGLRCAYELAKEMKDPSSHEYLKAAKEIHQSMHEHLYDKSAKIYLRRINYAGKKVIKDRRIDATLLWAAKTDCWDECDMQDIDNTVCQVKTKLWVKQTGGIARYENDPYHKIKEANEPGNPWLITTLWLGQYYVGQAKKLTDLSKAKEIIDWIKNHSLKTGIMPEQINPITKHPLSVSPLTWSHAEFVKMIVDYINKYKELEKI